MNSARMNISNCSNHNNNNNSSSNNENNNSPAAQESLLSNEYPEYITVGAQKKFHFQWNSDSASYIYLNVADKTKKELKNDLNDLNKLFFSNYLASEPIFTDIHGPIELPKNEYDKHKEDKNTKNGPLIQNSIPEKKRKSYSLAARNSIFCLQSVKEQNEAFQLKKQKLETANDNIRLPDVIYIGSRTYECGRDLKPFVKGLDPLDSKKFIYSFNPQQNVDSLCVKLNSLFKANLGNHIKLFDVSRDGKLIVLEALKYQAMMAMLAHEPPESKRAKFLMKYINVQIGVEPASTIRIVKPMI